jgi:NAD(P)-dependent dehydrogenase (short-subunit alcohol dehydrogenase family)
MVQKRVALITGASRGIGYEISRQLGMRSFQVVLTARSGEAGLGAADRLRKEGIAVTFIGMDVTDGGSIRQAVESFKERFDHLDVLVNNAGIMIEKTDILHLGVDPLLKTIRTNAIGTMLVTQAFAPLMQKGGRIINISSELGALGKMEGYSPAYSISKTMVNALTRQFAAVLKNDGISVHSVCPGWVRTAMGGEGAPRSPEQGAETAVWLATEAPPGLTGKYFKDKHEIEW